MTTNDVPVTDDYKLPDDLAVLLDGKVEPKVQTLIDKAKARIASRTEFAHLTDQERAFVVALVERAKTHGLLGYRSTGMRTCRVCGTKCGYRKVARTSKWKTKGEDDYDNPILVRGIDFVDSFVRMTGYPSLGACSVCVAKLMPDILRALESVPHERKYWPTGPSRWAKFSKMKCECGWRGHEGQMTRRPTLMGDGAYPAGCPSCGRQNSLFVSHVKHNNDEKPDFVVVEVPTKS